MAQIRLIFLVMLLAFKARLDALVDRLAKAAGYEKAQAFMDDLDAVAEEEGVPEEAEELFPPNLMEIAQFQVVDFQDVKTAAELAQEDGALELVHDNGASVFVSGPLSLAMAASLYASDEGAYFWRSTLGPLVPTHAWYAAPPFA